MVADLHLEKFARILPPNMRPFSLMGTKINCPENMILLEEQLKFMANIDLARSPGASKSMFPPVHFYFIDNTEINARALEKDNHGFIGVFRGATLLIRDMFYRMLSHPELMSNIGNPKIETIAPWHSQGLTTDYAELLADRPSDFTISDLEPRDPERLAFAKWLARIAMDFVMFHEIAHVRNGHCKYWNALTGQSFMVGYTADTTNVPPSIDPMTWQSIEVDADSFATCISFPAHTQFLERHPGLDLRIWGWCFAVICLFWQWGWWADPQSLHLSFYPPAPSRSHGAIGLAMQLCIAYGKPELAPHVEKLANQALASAKNAITTISGGIADPEIDDFYASKEAILIEHTERINAQWKIVRPVLQGYSYVTLSV